MRQASLGVKLFGVIAIFAIAAAGIVGSGVFGLSSLNQITNNLVNKEFQMQAQWFDVRDRLRLLELKERELINEEHAADVLTLQTQLDENYQSLHAVLSQYIGLADANGQAKAAQFSEIMERWLNVNRKVREAKTAGRSAEAEKIVLSEGKEVRLEADRFIEERIDANKKVMASRADEAEHNYIQARTSMIVFSVVAVAIGAILGFVILRSVTVRVRRVIESLNGNAELMTDSSGKIASSSDSLSQAATEQAASLEETAASIEELNQMVQRNLETARRAAEISGQSQESAEKGKQVVGEMSRAISEIDQSNAQIMTSIEESNRQIGEITKVIAAIGEKTKVINDIVFQTKLLSFNASVEAARAGEHGRGFAVVAEEVGNLAQMSGNASKEISAMLDDSIKKVEGIVNQTRSTVEVLVRAGKDKVEVGTRIAEECNSVLEVIVNRVVEVTGISQGIAQASQEQAQGVDQISRAMHQLDQVTQTNATGAEQAAMAAEELSEQGKALKGLIGTLSLVISGHGDTAGAPRLAPPSKEKAVRPTAKFTESGVKELRHETKKSSVPVKTQVQAPVKEKKAQPAAKKTTPAPAAKEPKKSNVVSLKRPVKKAEEPAPAKAAAGTDLSVPSENDPRFKDI